MKPTILNITPVKDWGIFDNLTRPLLIAGPCSAETEDQVVKTAEELHSCGVSVLRAGIWKPRTRPNCFEGVGKKGLPWLAEVKHKFGMKVSTEVASSKHVEEALKAGVDMLWIGARTTVNPFMVQEIADALKGVDIPVLVKNPINPDVELWVGALERLNMNGITKLGAIHRGFSFYGECKYRNSPLWQIPIEIRHRFPDLLMICDPSHISGKREYVREIAQQSMDLGFDGLIIESHICPEKALSDAAQQLTPHDYKKLIDNLIIRQETTDNVEYKETIEELRSMIDRIDSDLIDLLNSRMAVSEKIGYYKKANNITILQASRWDKILEKVFTHGSEHNLDRAFVEKIFKAIHQASIDKQTEIMNK